MEFIACGVPHFGIDIDTSFDPWEFVSRGINKIEYVAMVEITMKNTSAILVDPASSECFI
jgi:hypothetical protein